ncbi:Cytochrome b561 and DOMON domain-containing protein [Balamuthia mandrillaris]
MWATIHEPKALCALLALSVLTLASCCLADEVPPKECVEEPDIGFTGSMLLDEDSHYQVSWKLANNALTLKLSAQVTGWLGFGLAEQTSGSMLGADIVTAYVNDLDGTTVAEDRHVPWAAYPLQADPMPFPELDNCSHWEVLFGKQEDGHTTVIVRRALDTADPQDRPIFPSGGLQRVVYAWSASGDTVSYHSKRRGATAIDFSLNGPTHTSPPEDAVSSVELLMDAYAVSDTATTQYICRSFNVTELIGPGSRNVVFMEPVVKDKHVHHMLLHGCGNGASMSDIVAMHYPGHNVCSGGPAEGDMYGISPLGHKPCMSLMFGWAVGGGSMLLPDDVGMRIGEQHMQYLILEIHYDNPGMPKQSGVVDSSGVRLHFTKDLSTRQHEATSLTVGDIGINLAPIPAGQSAFHYEVSCPSACTNTFTGSLNVFGSFLHMHSVGRQIYMTKTSSIGDSAPSVVGRIDYWNFGFQQVTMTHSTLYTIDIGDKLNLHGVYDTSKLEHPVQFGDASDMEMLFNFMFVWPKENLNHVFLCGFYSRNDVGNFTLCGDNVILRPNPGNSTDDMGVLPAMMETLPQPTCKGPNPLSTCQGSTHPTPNPHSCNVSAGDITRSFTHCSELPLNDQKLKVFWTRHDNGDLAMAFQMDNVEGWLGYGFAKTAGKMVGSNVLIASHAEADVFAYRLLGSPRGANKDDDALNVTNKTVVSDGAQLTAFVTLLGIVGDKHDVVYATGAWTGQGPAYHHTNFGSGSIDFASGSVHVYESPQLKLKLHGLFMALGWGVLLPLGTFWPRFFKRYDPLWFHLHRVFQVLGLLMTFVALSLGLTAGSGTHTTHMGIGFTVMSIGAAVMLAGFLRPGKEHRWRSAWALFHFWFGRMGLLLAVVNICIGFTILEPAMAFWILYGLIVASMAVAFVVLTALSLVTVRPKASYDVIKEQKEDIESSREDTPASFLRNSSSALGDSDTNSDSNDDGEHSTDDRYDK